MEITRANNRRTASPFPAGDRRRLFDRGSRRPFVVHISLTIFRSARIYLTELGTVSWTALYTYNNVKPYLENSHRTSHVCFCIDAWMHCCISKKRTTPTSPAFHRSFDTVNRKKEIRSNKIAWVTIRSLSIFYMKNNFGVDNNVHDIRACRMKQGSAYLGDRECLQMFHLHQDLSKRFKFTFEYFCEPSVFLPSTSVSTFLFTRIQ